MGAAFLVPVGKKYGPKLFQSIKNKSINIEIQATLAKLGSLLSKGTKSVTAEAPTLVEGVVEAVGEVAGEVGTVGEATSVAGETSYGQSSLYFPGDENYIGPLTEPENHLIYGEGIGPKKRGVLGAHNKKNFYNTLDNTGFDLSDLLIDDPVEHSSIKGIFEQRYQVPKVDGRKNFIGFKVADSPKTYYDPTIISDSQMIQWGEEAMRNGIVCPDGKIVGRASNGLQFVGNVQKDGSIRFYPTLD